MMIPKRIILHCSDSPNGRVDTNKDIEKWHLARGFKKIGYHYVIGVKGELWTGRPLNEVGAHCEGDNHDSIGVCLIGKDQFSNAQWETLRRLLNELRLTKKIESFEIYGHYQMKSAIQQGKSCPNFPINRLLSWYLVNDQKAIVPHLLVTKL